MCESTMESLTTRDKIIDATLHLLDKEGLSNVTVRKIATLANVNVASLHYYFGSKDQTLWAAFTYVQNKLTTTYTQLDQPSLSKKERLTNFIYAYMTTALKHPDLFKYIMSQLMNDETSITDSIKNTLHQDMLLRLKALLPLDEPYVSMRLLQLMSGLAFPILLGPNLTLIGGLSLEEEPMLNDYIEQLVTTYLSD